MPAAMTAAEFIRKLKTYRSPEELKKIHRYFKTGVGEYSEGDEFMGVPMGQVFKLAKELIEMPPGEIALIAFAMPCAWLGSKLYGGR